MAQWTIEVDDELDHQVHEYLEQKGDEEANLAAFVARAVQQRLFQDLVEEIKQQNAHVDQDELISIIDEAVEKSRARRP